jgi:alpha-galactosidase
VRRMALIIAVVLVVALDAACQPVPFPRSAAVPASLVTADDGGLLAPPMGWNSWNSIGLGVDQARVKAEARALVSSGLRGAGYDYVVVDGGWRAPSRDARGGMQANPQKFPDGIKALAAYVHGLGLKFGIHQGVGMKDCSGTGPGTQTAPGGEQQDADTFASWGVDFLKYDLCGYRYPPGVMPGAPDFAAVAVRRGTTVFGRYPAVSVANRLTGGADVALCAQCADGENVTGIGLRDGRLQFNNVFAPSAGDYTLDVSYVNVDHSSAEIQTNLRQRRAALLSVDGGAPATTLYPVPIGPNGSPIGWGTVSTLSVPVHLQEGQNTLTFADPRSYEEVIRAAYQRMAEAIRRTGRPIVLSVSEHGVTRPWLWAPALGAMWRTTNDLGDFWSEPKPAGQRGPGATSIMTAVEEQVGLAVYAGPGGWNDPDMLQVGNGFTTVTEDQAHFSLWSILAAPLIAGNDLLRMTGPVRDILANREVIAVDQDPLAVEGRRTYDDGVGQVWVKPLADGSVAVVLLDSGPHATVMGVTAADLGLGTGALYSVRDLWAHSSTLSAGLIRVPVAAHGAVMLRVHPLSTRPGTIP